MNKKKEIVPKLRFPEFGASKGWKNYRLRELADRITQKVGNNKLVTLSISAGTGFVSQAEKFSRDISGKQYCNYIYLKKGEFSYNKGNSKTFPQGCIYELKEYKEAAVPNAFISFKFKENLVSSFYKGYFDSNFHGKQLVRFITSGARSDGLLNISPTDFFSIVLPTPIKKEEQQKIAECLSSIDELINAESRKLKALEKHKKGLMQKLFPVEGKTLPEWRFPAFKGCGEWKESTIDEVTSYVDYRGKTPVKSNEGIFLITAKNIKMGYIDYNVSKEYIPKDQYLAVMSRGIPQLGDVLITTEAPCGNVAQIDKVDVALAQRVIKYRGDKNKINNTFLKYVFLSPVFQSELKKNSTGGIVGGIKGSVLHQMSIKFPDDIIEQQKIADCLSEIDTIIKEQSNKVEQLKAHKKGLMQGLFPSLEEADV